MRRICFVYDFDGQDPKRLWTKELLDTLVDPVLAHLPEAIKVGKPDPDAVNVRFWSSYAHDDVYFGHAISDKNHRNADLVGHFGHIFHSGPAWQRKYLEQGIPAERLWQVGYTKLDPLFGLPQTRHTVLWAPTWARLWPQEHRDLSRLLEPLGVEVSEHCLDSPHKVTFSELVDADVVIADGGSTLYEAWALGKPVVFPDFAVGRLIQADTIEADIYQRQIGYHAHQPSDLERVIDEARTHGITQPERDLIDDIFPPELRGTSGKAHAEALREIAR